MYHIANEGKRSMTSGLRLKSEGLKAGMPDICLPVGRGVFHALYIELKVGDNKPSKKQKEKLSQLAAVGNKAVVCYGWEDAKNEICKYMTLKEERKNVD